MEFVLLVRSAETRTCCRSIACFDSTKSFLKQLVWILPSKYFGISISILGTLRSCILLTAHYFSYVRILQSYGCQPSLISCWSLVISAAKTMRVCINGILHFQSPCISVHLLDEVFDWILVLSSSFITWNISPSLFLFFLVVTFFLLFLFILSLFH